ncbi:transcriptional regulator [Selenomonas ruminis]|uniref:Transcriptional regulator n=1 Tax=Selenomonas ruminis TaxID=2593411 RepID=A0A5D6W9K4_9FIRM|nr:transcriptional regulator [Selenomonas sp. mPRGC5]TYZ24963.1 transcriptional regulator [Selenomonas sp. mPRGC5]
MEATPKAATWYNVRDVMAMMDVKESKAYEIIVQLNKELQEKGYMTIGGRVSRKYFNERFYG